MIISGDQYSQQIGPATARRPRTPRRNANIYKVWFTKCRRLESRGPPVVASHVVLSHLSPVRKVSLLLMLRPRISYTLHGAQTSPQQAEHVSMRNGQPMPACPLRSPMLCCASARQPALLTHGPCPSLTGPGNVRVRRELYIGNKTCLQRFLAAVTCLSADSAAALLSPMRTDLGSIYSVPLNACDTMIQ